MLSGRPGRLHMLFSPSIWFRGSFVSVLWGGHRLRCLGCPLLVILWLQHAFLFFRWLFFHILCLRCWPGWFLFHLSIFPFFLCLCIALGFLLLSSWGVCFQLYGFYWRYCTVCVLFLGQLLWILHLGFCLVLGSFSFSVSWWHCSFILGLWVLLLAQALCCYFSLLVQLLL